ncbi:MAG: helical backbone metal receptor [Chloroflexota bacterium]|nr:helical backbone metal receptor [Chloroflexota bacterium]
MRVVSLLPAGTDILAALGAVELLVGVTHECDYPPEITALPRVTRSAIDARAAPSEVDQQVRTAGTQGEPLFTLDRARIAELRPDVVLTQAMCEVCAVRETDVRALAARLTPPPRVVALDGSTLEGVFDDITRVAEAVEKSGAAVRLMAALEERMRRVHETLTAAAAPRPRVAVIEWTDPVYAAGHWVPSMVDRAGGIDVLAASGEHSRVVELAEVEAAAPDTIVFAPCGYDVVRATTEGRRTLGRAEWAWAARCRAWAIDANGLVSRPGPRLVDGIETFAQIFHPTLFSRPPLDRAVELTL